MPLTNQTIGPSGITGGTHTIQLTDTAQRVRLYDLAFLTEGASGAGLFTTSRPGILSGPPNAAGSPPATMAASATGTGLNIAISPGAAVVERGTLVGSYVVAAYQSGQVTLATADPTNPRYDRVDLQVLDGALGDNGGTSLTRYVVTTGVAAGSPSVPAAPINSIPITQILLPAGTTTLTGAMMADKRRGTGLRGASRYMLPGDLLTDPGYLAGEQRIRILAGYPSNPLAMDYWGADGAWHGAEPSVLPLIGTWANGTSDITASSETQLFSIAIPDPGWAYYVKYNYNVGFFGLTSTAAAQLNIRLTNLSGAVYGGTWGENSGSGSEHIGASGYLRTIPGSSAPVIQKWTGTNTFIGSFQVLGSGTATCRNPSNFVATDFSVEVIPV